MPKMTTRGHRAGPCPEPARDITLMPGGTRVMVSRPAGATKPYSIDRRKRFRFDRAVSRPIADAETAWLRRHRHWRGTEVSEGLGKTIGDRKLTVSGVAVRPWRWKLVAAENAAAKMTVKVLVAPPAANKCFAVVRATTLRLADRREARGLHLAHRTMRNRKRRSILHELRNHISRPEISGERSGPARCSLLYGRYAYRRRHRCHQRYRAQPAPGLTFISPARRPPPAGRNGFGDRGAATGDRGNSSINGRSMIAGRINTLSPEIRGTACQRLDRSGACFAFL
jgi:hypothetical protein